tara:strand:- start:205 stop:672 length:468 start_codon:yes stop_codon:yes gene_type:complete
MKLYSTVFLSLTFFLFACKPSAPTEPIIEIQVDLPHSIEAKLEQQTAAWNIGDINGFMENAYWNSDSLIFVGSRGLTHGFTQTLANYKQSYSNHEEMGQLTFELIEWRPLGPGHGLLVGSWLLKREAGLENLNGHFSLTWELQAAGWVIIADHSS